MTVAYDNVSIYFQVIYKSRRCSYHEYGPLITFFNLTPEILLKRSSKNHQIKKDIVNYIYLLFNKYNGHYRSNGSTNRQKGQIVTRQKNEIRTRKTESEMRERKSYL